MKLSTVAGVVIVVAILMAGAYVVLQPEQVVAPENTTPPLVEDENEVDGLTIEELLASPNMATEETKTNVDATDDTEAEEIEETSTEIKAININDDGFEPANITISIGTTVSFLNNGQAKHWPASDIHPTHKSYPGSDIKKCGGEESAEIFDACRGLETGEQYSFTFNEPGSWNYHDHLFPKFTGTITVE